MNDERTVPHETNWADYIDALRPFQPPTSRLVRRQLLLDVPTAESVENPRLAAAPWWQPAEPDGSRT